MSSVRLAAGYFHANLQAALEYRASFFAEVSSMLINDGMWLVFWVAYFDRFPAVSGWGRAEIVTLWAVVATGFGVATMIFGNSLKLAGMIHRGEIDFFLTLPRPVLLHALVSRMSLSAWGDIAFGAVAFGFFTDPGPLEWGLFVLFSLSNAAIITGFSVAVSSPAFWLGEAEGVAQQAVNVLIMFSTYPTSIFRGAVKTMLFTVVPAGFVAFVPVEVIRLKTWTWLFYHLGVAAAFVAFGAIVFHRGLRRYESGNLFTTRS
jgi:ABC-2 type transport system permease protein